MIIALCFAMMTGSPIVDLQRPELTIAQGYVESGMKAKARGKAGELGAWQVIEKYYGKVPKKLHQQAKQAESILNELLTDNADDLEKALQFYNSRKNTKAGKRYVAKVRQEAFRVCLLDILD